MLCCVQVLEQHRHYLAEKDIRGRIYISTQGINAQFGGLTAHAIEYTQWVSQQPFFQVLLATAPQHTAEARLLRVQCPAALHALICITRESHWLDWCQQHPHVRYTHMI